MKLSANQTRIRNLKIELMRMHLSERDNPAQKTQQFIDNLQNLSYPLNQDEEIAIDTELQKEVSHNDVLKNITRLREKCELKKFQWTTFLEKQDLLKKE
jgi:hypothetical protein